MSLLDVVRHSRNCRTLPNAECLGLIAFGIAETAERWRQLAARLAWCYVITYRLALAGCDVQ
jgi:hypothetical protein